MVTRTRRKNTRAKPATARPKVQPRAVETKTVLDGLRPDDPLLAVFADEASRAKFAALIEETVQARMKEVSPGDASKDIGAFAKTLENMLRLQAMQMPGYFPPLPTEEVERRASALVEMQTLLREARENGTPPQYYVGPEKFFGNTEYGPVMFEEGHPIKMFIPPPEDFTPCYEGKDGPKLGAIAERVLDAQFRYLGGKTPDIGELERQAREHARLPTDMLGVVGEPDSGRPKGDVELVEGVARREPVAKAAFVTQGETVMGHDGVRRPPQAPGPRNAAPVGPAYVEG